MIVALIDNGSLEPAAHRNLRRVAAALSERSGVTVHAVSWKHSDRIDLAALDGIPAWTLAAFVRALVALGQREFVFVPFFISAQGAIGSALHSELEALRAEHNFEFSLSSALAAAGVISPIVADRVRATIAAKGLTRPPVVVVDHGGPSPASAALRDQLAGQVATKLGRESDTVVAASMEGAHPPLLADQLSCAGLTGQDVVVAPLFLSPGRHAGPGGDIARICAASAARCHITDLVGTHPLAIDALADALRLALSTFHVPSLA
jgi:sirohydrochlorin ferrochelatase